MRCETEGGELLRVILYGCEREKERISLLRAMFCCLVICSIGFLIGIWWALFCPYIHLLTHWLNRLFFSARFLHFFVHWIILWCVAYLFIGSFFLLMPLISCACVPVYLDSVLAVFMHTAVPSRSHLFISVRPFLNTCTFNIADCSFFFVLWMCVRGCALHYFCIIFLLFVTWCYLPINPSPDNLVLIQLAHNR